MALTTISFPEQEQQELKPRLAVFGIGGAGGNAVNNMIDKGLQGVEFIVANTDAQALAQSRAPNRIQLGRQLTEGLGAGARPDVGARAAEEALEEIVAHLEGAHMCFLTAGMGGGTGTGAAPIIARAARELGILTVGVVTKPFQFEGFRRMRQAEEGIEELQGVVDTLIIIPNQNLFRLATENTTFTEAFAMADDVLYQGVKGITDLMVRPGLINLDFADVRAVMDEMGKAMMGTGEASGESRAREAAAKAIANPLLDEISLEGARGVLINISGGADLTLFELDEAANLIREKVDPDANIIVGSTLDPEMEGVMRVSVVATGIDASERRAPADLRPSVAAAAPAATTAPEAEPAAEPATGAPAGSDIAATETVEAAPEPTQPPLFEEPAAALAEDDAFEEELSAVLAEEEAPAPAEPELESFVPPSRPRAGQPRPEAVRKLQEITGKRGVAARPAEPPAREGGSRFGGGIGSLITRMTGHGHAARPAPRRTTPGNDEPAEGAERDDVEIPAFLRRQAN